MLVVSIMPALGTCRRASLRIVSAYYGDTNVTRVVQAAVQNGQLHAVGGIETLIPMIGGPSATGVPVTKPFQVTYMLYTVKATAFVGMLGDDRREVCSHFSAAANDSICYSAAPGDFFAVATVSAMATKKAPSCSAATVTVKVDAAIELPGNPVEGPTPFDPLESPPDGT